MGIDRAAYIQSVRMLVARFFRLDEVFGPLLKCTLITIDVKFRCEKHHLLGWGGMLLTKCFRLLHTFVLFSVRLHNDSIGCSMFTISRCAISDHIPSILYLLCEIGKYTFSPSSDL